MKKLENSVSKKEILKQMSQAINHEKFYLQTFPVF